MKQRSVLLWKRWQGADPVPYRHASIPHPPRIRCSGVVCLRWWSLSPLVDFYGLWLARYCINVDGNWWTAVHRILSFYLQRLFLTFSREGCHKNYEVSQCKTASRRRNKGNYVATARDWVCRLSRKPRGRVDSRGTCVGCLVRNCRKSLHVLQVQSGAVPSGWVQLRLVLDRPDTSQLSMTLSGKLICFDIRLNARPWSDRWR